VSRPRRFDIDAVAFDLDGTLVDTVGELAQALGATLAHDGLAPLDVDVVRDLIGKGIPVLLDRAYVRARGRGLSPAELEAIVPRYHAHYDAAIGRSATPFAGAAAMLADLRARGFALAVVTNKATRFVAANLDHAGLGSAFDAIVGGDDARAKKPDPAPMHLAAERLGVAPARMLVVGDSANDVASARAAGAPVVAVPWGYREGAGVQELGADAIVDSFDALGPMLDGPARRAPTR